MSGLPILLVSGLGVALLAGLTSGARARRAQSTAPGGGSDQRRRRRRPAQRTSSSTRSTSNAPAPPKPTPKAKRRRKKRARPKETPVPLNKEYTITTTTAETPIAPHTVHVEPEPPPKPDSAPTVSPRGYAQRLYDYARGMISADRATELGTKGKPNATVRAYQGGMGKLKRDGIYGPKTRARGKELLGKSFPVRKRAEPVIAPEPAPPPPPPAAMVLEAEETATEIVRSPREAAQDLFEYAKRAPRVKGRGAWFGTKLKPNATVAQAQRDMGELTDDGIYGPKTRRRGRALLGRVFPAR